MIIQRILGSIFGRLQSAYYNHRYASYKKKYRIHSNFRFQGTDIRVYGEGQMILGNNSYIGSLSTIQLEKKCKVSIGEYCMISHNVRIYTSTNIADQDFRNNKEYITKSGDVIIGDGVWIGANVFIDPGVSIGNNSVIGANSVVTKNIPDNAIYGGVPASLIRYKKQDE